MKYGFQLLLLAASLFVANSNCHSQGSKLMEIQNDNIESLLPPLQVLIDSAIAHNPGIRSADLQTKVLQYKLNVDKSSWTKNLGLQTDVRYGTFDTFSTNTSAGQTPSTQATQNSQLNYGVGAFVKIPIFDAISRKYLLKSDQLEIEQTINLSEAQRNDLRQMVIKLYNDFILKHKLFVIKMKYAETIKINMQLAEKEFQNGVMNLDNYTRVCDTYARSEADFESVKMDLKTAYMTLEVVVGIKFNIIL